MRVLLGLLLALAGMTCAHAGGFVVKPAKSETAYPLFQNAETWKDILPAMEKIEGPSRVQAADIRAKIARGGYVTVFFHDASDFAENPINFSVSVSDAKGKELVKKIGDKKDAAPEGKRGGVMELILPREPVFPLKVTIRDSRKAEPELFEIWPQK